MPIDFEFVTSLLVIIINASSPALGIEMHQLGDEKLHLSTTDLVLRWVISDMIVSQAGGQTDRCATVTCRILG